MTSTLLSRFTFSCILFEIVECPKQMFWPCILNPHFLMILQLQSLPNFSHNNWVNEEDCCPLMMKLKCSTGFSTPSQHLFSNPTEIFTRQTTGGLFCSFALGMGGESSLLLVCWFLFIVRCANCGGCVETVHSSQFASPQYMQATIKNTKW